MRYDNDGVRVGVLGHESRSRRSSSHLLYLDGAAARLPLGLGYDRNNNDTGGGRAGSLKVLFYGYVHELVWFCTRLNNEFSFLFVFQLLYER